MINQKNGKEEVRDYKGKGGYSLFHIFRIKMLGLWRP